MKSAAAIGFLGFLFCAPLQAQDVTASWLAQLSQQKTAEEKHLAALQQREARASSALTQANAALAKARSLDDQPSVAIAQDAVAVSTASLQKIEADKKATLARLAGIENDFAQASHAVPNLAADARLAQINSLALDELNGRIARIHKAIQILGEDNPEWKKEWDQVRSDMRRDHQRIGWAAVNLLTIGLAESGKYLSELNAEDAEAILGRMDWPEIQREKASLVELSKTWGGPAMDKWIADLDRLENAYRVKETAKYSAILRDAISEGKDLYAHAEQTGASPEILDKIYHGSVILGEAGIIFVEGIAGKAAAAAGAAASIGEMGLLLKNLHEEDQQLGALDAQAYDRHVEIRELDAKLAALEKRRANFEWGSQRAGREAK